MSKPATQKQTPLEVTTTFPQDSGARVEPPKGLTPQETSRLITFIQDLNSTLELDRVLEKVADCVRQNVGFDTFSILIADERGQELRFLFGVGYSEQTLKCWRFGMGQGLVGTVAQTGKLIRVGDVSRDSRYIDAGEAVASELALPLISKNRTIGVLDVGSRTRDYFTEKDEQLLGFLASHLANAIENARLYEKVREQAQSLSVLHEVGRNLTSILDREKLLSQIAQTVKRLIDYQMFCVMLWNEESQLLEHTFSLRDDERFCQKGGIPLGNGICGTAAALRQTVRVANVDLDPRYIRCGHSVDIRSELVASLVFEDRLIGVIDLESVEYNAFTAQHEQMLATLASTIAVSLENSSLYQRLRESEQRLAGDLEMAREIQKGLLPERAPQLPGLEIGVSYEPALELGGDFYDFLPYPDGRLGIAVGDVSGKATPAALFGSLAVGILRGRIVQEPCCPGEMLKLMNDHLGEPRLDSRSVAMAFAVYDGKENSLRVANSGFPLPLLVRDGRVEEVRVVGVPLGLLPGSTYQEQRLALKPGDLLVFSSDGLHESTNERDEEFGLEGLRQVIVTSYGQSAQKLADLIVKAVRDHASSNGVIQDDRTVVVLKVTAS